VMKLLLVDDDAFLRDMYGTKFTECGHVVHTAENSVIALNKINKESHYDVILLDMVMPGMTGVEMIAEIKERFPDIQTKFIMLSNQGQTEDVERAKQAGVIGYIIKAESIPSDVVKKVEELTNQEK
jgi:CheY-like chemotaxis protein